MLRTKNLQRFLITKDLNQLYVDSFFKSRVGVRQFSNNIVQQTGDNELEPKMMPRDQESLVQLYNQLKSELWRLPPPPPQKHNQPAPPWTPTRLLKKRKIQNKRMAFLMQVLNREYFEKIKTMRPRPDVEVGDVVQVDMVVPENKGREQSFRGLCVRRHRKGHQAHILLVNYFKSTGRVERLFPVYSPNITDIKILSSRQVTYKATFHRWVLNKPSSYYTIE
eukprot:TRINITY_DN689_c0_g1_i7.p1 TRINITY_DN689_c0_g1~~TRINITY_DN689_c0_g1_i7.p1  ORF type:complete len:257 (-),score=22.05 TRINITY_DN689_c0_g1_i7:569-1234(-)